MLKEYIKKVSEHHDLTTEEMKTAMNIIMDGRASSEQVSAFLIAMKMKKESPAEIAAASRVMVSKATPLPTDVKGIVDIVGTGGDCLNTFNISTTSSFVLCTACQHHPSAKGSSLSAGEGWHHLSVCPDLS